MRMIWKDGFGTRKNRVPVQRFRCSANDYGKNDSVLTLFAPWILE